MDYDTVEMMVAAVLVLLPLAMAMFPPPFDAYLDSGRGLDLRGMIIVGGAMLGGAVGVVTSVVVCIANLVRQFIQEDRPAARAHLIPDQSPIPNGS